MYHTNVKSKYQLPPPHGGMFFKDDKQLKRSFRLWMRWLPCWLLWRIHIWMYFH